MAMPADVGAWIVGLAGSGLGLYTLVRIFKKDSRSDKQVDEIDASMQQIITTLRAEVERLAKRVTDMEHELVRVHDINTQCQNERIEYLQERAELLKERVLLIARLQQCEAAEAQAKLL